MSPSLTVLIPTWNRSRHILPSLRSVLAQDDVDFEVILCGDGCDDDTADVVRPFLGPRVRWINLPDVEPSSTRVPEFCRLLCRIMSSVPMTPVPLPSLI
jgi:hypothetical protein